MINQPTPNQVSNIDGTTRAVLQPAGPTKRELANTHTVVQTIEIVRIVMDITPDTGYSFPFPGQLNGAPITIACPSVLQIGNADHENSLRITFLATKTGNSSEGRAEYEVLWIPKQTNLIIQADTSHAEAWWAVTNFIPS